MTQPDRGGRPKKPASEVRSYRAATRFTAEEKLVVSEKMEAAGMTQAEYLRFCALDEGRALPAVSQTIKRRIFDPELYLELNPIGNNLNQIAHSLHVMPNEKPRHLVRAIGRLESILTRLEEGLADYK